MRGSVLLVMLDGVGLGSPDPRRNPFVGARLPTLTGLLGGALPLLGCGVLRGPQAVLVPTDACLGMPGLPQSATGQTALLTGENAARLAGGPVSAYPTRPLAELLCRQGLFRQVNSAGGRSTFLNAFRPESLEGIAEGTYRATATTVAALGAGVRLRTFKELEQGRAVTHDVTGAHVRRLGLEVEEVAPEEAGRRAARVAAEHNFTLFEHFLTDLFGHAGDLEGGRALLEVIDGFLAGALEVALSRGVTVVVASDHGNLEDASVSTHTVNPVPTLAVGPGWEAFSGVGSLTDIAPAVMEVLGEGRGGGRQASGRAHRRA
ncbi:MAG: hypothetical protein K6T75_07325 [Acetobacteraceae bacterium]|nr:hypothetical protein [Acetobacteraceae bacterium]